jgi:hypothetical protein
MSGEDVLDAALDDLAAYGPDLANGFTSHAPMVVEALVALGRADAVRPWLERYRPGLLPRPRPAQSIDPSGWQAALGREERSADWMAFLRAELAAAPWRAVLARWAARLAPAYCTNALHGPLRVAHAARSLARRETPQRVRELADALGAWAANHQTLPVAAPRRAGGLSPGAAIEAVPLQPPAERRFRGSIVSALEGLTGFAAFAPVIDWIDVTPPPERVVTELTRAFARVFLANARDPLGAIVFAHGVTGAAALRSLLPLVDADTARELLRHAWQAGAALLASLGSEQPAAGAPGETPLEPAALAAAAVLHGDDHAIKLTEACLREYAIEPDPIYPSAAAHALAALPEGPR